MTWNNSRDQMYLGLQGKGKYKEKPCKTSQHTKMDQRKKRCNEQIALGKCLSMNGWSTNSPKGNVAKENGNLVSIKYQTKGNSWDN